MDLYAVAVRLQREEFPGSLTLIRHEAAFALARSKGDACHEIMERYRQSFPESEGWHSHIAVATQVPVELAQKALGFYYDAPLDILGLPNWVFYKLYRNGIRDVGGALKLISRGVDAFPQMMGVGNKTLAVLRKALEYFGYIPAYLE